MVASISGHYLGAPAATGAHEAVASSASEVTVVKRYHELEGVAMPGMRTTSLATLVELDAQIESMENPRHRLMLAGFRDHYWAEVRWDVPAIMATFAPTGVIGHWYHGGHFGGWEGRTIEGRAALIALYEAAATGGAVVGPLNDPNWTFGEHGLNVAACFTLASHGAGMPNTVEPLEPEQLYVIRLYQSVYFPFDETGRFCLGEVIYAADQPESIEPITAEEAAKLTGIPARTP
jgi:hypothetical protein